MDIETSLAEVELASKAFGGCGEHDAVRSPILVWFAAISAHRASSVLQHFTKRVIKEQEKLYGRMDSVRRPGMEYSGSMGERKVWPKPPTKPPNKSNFKPTGTLLNFRLLCARSGAMHGARRLVCVS